MTVSEEEKTQANTTSKSGKLLVTYDKKIETPDGGTESSEVTSEMTVVSTQQAQREALHSSLVIEVKRLVALSKDLQTTINEAKTKPKKDLYGKKLAKNNKHLMNMIMRLDAFNKEEK